MKVTDRSGYAVFSGGDVGAAHVLAHHLLDSGQVELGHHRLGLWLAGRTGSGSDWAHIQFHMAVFELGVGDWKAAYARLIEELLPIAATSEDALTDAPALAWRLALRAGRSEPLPWEALRNTALRSLRRPNEPFIELHNLLAIAGAGDTAGIRAWLDASQNDTRSSSSNILVRMAEGLSACTQKNYRRAAGLLKGIVPELSSIGGSLAQNALFTELQARMAAA
jgi:hypothetical protein